MRSMLVCIALALGSSHALAQECAEDYVAVTASDATVPVPVLSSRVKPLTKCELEVEAQAWQDLLQAKVAEISDTEVAAFLKKQEIELVEQAESALQDAREAAEKADDDAAKEAAAQAREVLQKEQEAERRKEEKKKEKQVAVASKSAEEKAAIRTALVEYEIQLTAQRTALIDRLEVVLTELAAKGGDRTSYDSYIGAVSGIKVDVTDASATWTTISGWLRSPDAQHPGVHPHHLCVLPAVYRGRQGLAKGAREIKERLIIAQPVHRDEYATARPVRRIFCRPCGIGS